MDRNRKILLVSVMILFSLVSQASSIILAPGIVELNLSPGGVKFFTLNVTNKVGAKDTRCRIYVTDVEIIREGKVEYPKAGTVKYSCANWIEASPQEIFLKAGEVKKINCKVLVPTNAIGAKSAAVMCELIPDTSIEKEAASIIHLRIASIVKLNIGKSGLQDKLVISEMNILPGDGTTTITLTLKNEGNTCIVPQGTLTVKNKASRIYTQVPITSITYTMFPTDIRYFKAIFQDKLPDDKYIVEARINYGIKKWAIGRWDIVVKDGIMEKKVGKEEIKQEEFIQFSVKPSSIELNNIPSMVFRSGIIQIYNDEREPIHIEAELKDISIETDGEIKYIEHGSSSYTCNPFFSLFPTTFNLASKAQGYIKYTFKSNREIKGGRYGVIIIKVNSKDNRTEKAIIPIGVSILDTVNEEINLTQLKISSHVKQLTVSFLLTNTGNVGLRPKGKIMIKDKGEKVIEEILLKDDIDLYPTGGRLIKILHSHNLKTGDYIGEIEINYGDKKSIVERKNFFVRR